MLAQAHGVLPFHGGVIGDAVGNAWLPVYDLPARLSHRYFVISADGRWLGTVELPGAFRILDIAEDRILVVEENDVDVEAVAVYRLEKQDPVEPRASAAPGNEGDAIRA